VSLILTLLVNCADIEVIKGDLVSCRKLDSLMIADLRYSPYTYAEMKARGRTESELMSILEHVHLAYLPQREGGWETRKEWKDVLSSVNTLPGSIFL
jgi:hypothetical protein